MRKTEAGIVVCLEKTTGLEECLDCRRANEIEAALLQIFRYPCRRFRYRDLSQSRVSCIRPLQHVLEIGKEGTKLVHNCERSLRIANHRLIVEMQKKLFKAYFDFTSVSDNASRFDNFSLVCRRHACNLLRIKHVE